MHGSLSRSLNLCSDRPTSTPPSSGVLSSCQTAEPPAQGSLPPPGSHLQRRRRWGGHVLLLQRNPTCSKLWAEALLQGRFAGRLQKCNLPKNYTYGRDILCWGYRRNTSAQQMPEWSLLPNHDGLRGHGMLLLNVGSGAACALLRCSASARRTQGPARGGQERDSLPGAS